MTILMQWESTEEWSHTVREYFVRVRLLSLVVGAVLAIYFIFN